MRPAYINGKFYSGSLNGVHRVSDRLIHELDHKIGSENIPPITLLLPTKHKGNWRPQLSNIVIKEIDQPPSQSWEQISLPKLAADGVLVNLANLSPIRHKRKITLIHDAQFLFPDSSYPSRQRLGYRFLTPLMAKSSSKVLTVSDFSRRMLDIMGVSKAAKTDVLYNGIDHVLEVDADESILKELGICKRGYSLMFGSHKSYKNNEVVFNAYSQENLSDIPLVLVGTTKEALLQAGLKVPDGTIFANKCSDSKLRALYANARCLLCPSRTEGFGLPPLEAMLCGTPAVIAPAGALPEVCRDAVLYADVDDPSSWTTAIRALVPESPLFVRKVTEGLTQAKRFTWSESGDQLLSHILELCRT